MEAFERVETATVPASLRSLFTATIQERDDTYVLEIPKREVDNEVLTEGETYRVAIRRTQSNATQTRDDDRHGRLQHGDSAHRSEPPVDEGEVRTVTIEAVGAEGDGIAKVERGYVVIVPDTHPGDEPTVEIENVQETVAFASVVERT